VPALDLKRQNLQDFVLCYPKLAIAYNFIPKNACTTAKLSLGVASRGHLEGRPNPHDWNDDYRPPADFSEHAWKRLLILRDPADRLVSAYLNRVARPADLQTTMLVDWLWERSTGAKPRDQGSISFRVFWEWVREQPFDNLDAHWRHQSMLLAFDSYDYVIAVDGLQQGWKSSGLERLAPLLTSDEHATTSSHCAIDTPDVFDTPGHYLQGFKVTTGMFPPKQRFLPNSIRDEIKHYYASDYALLKRYGLEGASRLDREAS